MTRVAAAMLTVAVLGWTAGVGGFGGSAPPRAWQDEEFSPLFARRLALASERLDEPHDGAVLTAGMRMEQPVDFIASGNPYSYCIGSVCLGSACLGSACLGSTCMGSGCSGSTCAGSACVGSTCLGSLCVGSRCLGSVCGSCSVTDPMPEEERS
jgi:hypothetical protein